LDISMPGRNGMEILKDIKRLKPEIAILMLSVYPEEQYALRALKLGASGYLTKESVPGELIKAIRHVAGGGKYITPEVAESIAFDFDKSNDNPKHKNLSDREFEVMCFIAEGKSTTEIARELSLSTKTISTYRDRIYVKMKLKTSSEIIRYALKEGLVE